MTLADKVRLQMLLHDYQRDVVVNMFSSKNKNNKKKLKECKAQYNHIKMIQRRLSTMISDDLNELYEVK